MAVLGLGVGPRGASHSGARPEPTSATTLALLLRRARAAGIRVLDIAGGADTEDACRAAGARDLDVRWITRTSAPVGDEAALVAGVESSRAALGEIYGLLERDPSALCGPDGPGRIQRLEDLQRRGWVSKVGLHAQEAADLDAVMSASYPQIVLVPANALDRRLPADGSLESLSRLGVEVHVHSTLLQGRLLMDPAHIPGSQGALREAVAAFQTTAAAHGKTPLEGALGFACGLPEVDVVIVGVETLEQLDALLAARDGAKTVDPEWFRGIGCEDPAPLDPRTQGCAG